MLFNSVEFLIFLPVVMLVFFILPGKVRNYWLLIASYYFYMCWNAEFGLLILFSTVVTYATALLLEKTRKISLPENAKDEEAFEKSQRGKMHAAIAICFIVNLGILFYFKYFNFATELINDIFDITGLRIIIPRYDIMLPVGISFYTFQALGYIVDVYRGEIEAERNFFTYALFVSFFPQLVAGPIERSGNLLHQLKTTTRFDYENFRKGVMLMLWGFFLKIVLADRIAIYVDFIFERLDYYKGWYIILAVFFFAIQIYCDFYGYSIIAKGAAAMLNIELMENFNAPYFSTSVAEFWRNWHISLTSWFKDYLYIPLGGSRKGKVRKYLNKMVVFLVSGLWHGADLTYVIWGGINGLYQVIGEMTLPIRKRVCERLKFDRNSGSAHAFQTVFTLIIVWFSWIFFRADNIEQALLAIQGIFAENNIWILFDGSLYGCGLNYKNFVLVFICIFILTIADLNKKRGIVIHEALLKQNAWFTIPMFVVLICAVMIFGIWGPVYEGANFIYFQF